MNVSGNLITACTFLALMWQSTPSFASSPNEQDASKNQIENSMRISRPSKTPDEFHALSSGMTNRWWRKFRNPSFCPYVLCGNSCSDISGKPRIGAYTEDQLNSDSTPCSLDAISNSGSSSSCCMSKSINQGFANSCTDGSCCNDTHNSIKAPGK